MMISSLRKACLLGLYALAILYVIQKWNSPEWTKNPMYPFIAILLVGLVGVIYFALVIMPKIGDRVSHAVLSSNHEVEQDESTKAAAKVATGDYHGAMEVWKKLDQANPSDPYATSEIAKILADRLQDPSAAVEHLHEALSGREWSQDHAAFLLFRLVDLHVNANQSAEARSVLEQVIQLFPDTRFSANATYRLRDLDRTAI